MPVKKEPLVIAEQGTFSAGGYVLHSEGDFNPLDPPNPYIPPKDIMSVPQNGQSLHVDNAHVFYQIPVNARKYPLVLHHGGFNTMKCWQTTPDGREGYQNIFLRKNYSVYLVDQPRRGEAGCSAVPYIAPVFLGEETQFNILRMGVWPDFYEGVQFPRTKEAYDQFNFMPTGDHGPYDMEVITDGMAAVFEKTGDAIYVTHSQSGGLGWLTATKTDKIKAIVSYEPGSCFLFPEGEAPETLHTCKEWDVLSASTCSKEDFLKLTRFPIIIYYGDNIAKEMSDDLGKDHWRVRVEMAQMWVDKVNEYGGDAQLVLLPDIGIMGNTHCIFSDPNNEEVADVMAAWLHEKGLD